jgi:hypothetical protein
MKTNRARISMQSPARLTGQNTENAIAGAADTARRLGFRPAFLDCATMRIHPSRFFDGRPAPYHCLDGLPDEAVLLRLPSGRVVHAKVLTYGFERGGFFYTRTATSRACEEWAAAVPGSLERNLPPLW